MDEPNQGNKGSGRTVNGMKRVWEAATTIKEVKREERT